MNPRDWMKSGEYLPDFLKDFHDQKDCFKTIDLLFKKSPELEFHTWVSNQIFTVDFFLWFCGIHGYTLQRSRKKGVEFEDVNATINSMMQQWKRDLPPLSSFAQGNPQATEAIQGAEARDTGKDGEA